MSVIANSFQWIVFNAFIVMMIATDFALGRNKVSRSLHQSLTWSGIWIALALSFSVWVFIDRGTELGLQFLTAYVIEKSLSIDNIFAFYMVFEFFKINTREQHKVLIWGVCGALVMRALLIILGSALVARHQWILYFFGAFLVWTGCKMLTKGDEGGVDPAHNRLIQWIKAYIPLAKDNPSGRFFVFVRNRWHITTLFLALILIEASDLIFAVDSIPAVFAISQDPYIVYTSNVFAILGLRALYFALAGVIEKFQNLKTALSLILVLIGGKMLLAFWIELPIWLSLVAIAVLIVGSILLPQKGQHSKAQPKRSPVKKRSVKKG